MNINSPEQPVLSPLPPGYTARPMRPEDTPAITAMLNAEARHWAGVDKYTQEDVSSDWGWGGADPELNSRLLFAPDGELVGYEGLWAEDAAQGQMYIWGRVHPAHTGRGLTSHLLDWADQRACSYLHLAPPDARVALIMGMYAINQPGCQVLLEHGYEVVRHYFRMVTSFDAPPPPPQWPTGIQVRSYQPGPDDLPTMRLVSDAFRDHWGHVEHSEEADMEIWRKIRLEAFDFDPTLYFLAMDGDQIAGASLCRPSVPDDQQMGYVWTLAVGRPWRKRGLGEALLHHSFQEFYRRGKQRASLHVDADSLTNAVRLYEKVGMRSDPQRLMTRFEKVLRPGRDLREHGVGT